MAGKHLGATLVHRTQSLRIVDLLAIIKDVLMQQRKVTFHRRLAPSLPAIHFNTKVDYENPLHQCNGQEP
jgi:hypothetical protein